MNKALMLAATILIATLPLGAAAQSDPPPRDKSVKQEIKSDAREAKQEIKSSARKVKRKLAVAVCNDGRYSYKTYHTCSNHGGVRTRLR